METLNKVCPDFAADAQLGNELSRHSARREPCNPGALDEQSSRFRGLWDEASRAEVESRPGRGDERAL